MGFGVTTMNRWFQGIFEKYSKNTLIYPNILYKDLKELSDKYAYHFKKSGVVGGLYVPICEPNSADFIAKLVALWGLQAVPCLMPPRLNGQQRNQVWEHISSMTPSEEEALVILTSGTTSKLPKGVRLSHDNIHTHVNMLRNHISPDMFSSADRTFSFLPWTHSYGLLGECFSVMDRGASMGVLSPDNQLNFRIPYFFKEFHTTSPTILFVVPHLLENLTQHNRRMRTFIDSPKIRRGMLFGNKVRFLVSGGARLNPDTRRELWEDLNVPVLEGYGCTEMLPMISLQKAFHVDDTSVGDILPGVDIKIGNDKEVCVKGGNRFLGYIGEPPRQKDEYYRTGDLGYTMNNKLYLTGRKSRMVKLRNGKFIDIEELERAVARKLTDCKDICLWHTEEGQFVGVAHFDH